MNQSISLNPKQVLTVVNRYRKLLTISIVAALLGYAGYQVSQISAVQPDAGYVAVQQKTSKVPNLHANQKVIDQLKNLQTQGDTSIQVTTGKQNPFTLN